MLLQKNRIIDARFYFDLTYNDAEVTKLTKKLAVTLHDLQGEKHSKSKKTALQKSEMEKNLADAIAKAAANANKNSKPIRKHQMAQFESKLDNMHAKSDKTTPLKSRYPVIPWWQKALRK